MMNRYWSRGTLATLIVVLTTPLLAADELKPFVLASVSRGDFAESVALTKQRLQQAGFEVVGEFSPYEQTFVEQAHVIVVTHDELIRVAQLTKYGSFAAPCRVAVTRANGVNQVAYANPEYLAHAYRLDSDLSLVATKLQDALGFRDNFGSEKGLSRRVLARYRYAFGMERFTDVYELAEYGSHAEAVAALEKNLHDHVAGISKVYRLDVGRQTTLFGVARNAATPREQAMDDHFIMSTVDFQSHKGTAYLPYEILVDGNKVVALHMRFRMALHYPDLKMMGANSFMKLMSSPAAIERALARVAGG